MMNKILIRLLIIVSLPFTKKVKINGILVVAQKRNDIAINTLKNALRIIDENSNAENWKLLVNRNVKGMFLHNYSCLPLSVFYQIKLIISDIGYISQISPLLCASMLIRWASIIALNVDYSSRIPITKQLLFLSQYDTEEANDMMKGLESYYKNHHLL